jgi:uncharacterized protein YbjT (DUF2867 family)
MAVMTFGSFCSLLVALSLLAATRALAPEISRRDAFQNAAKLASLVTVAAPLESAFAAQEDLPVVVLGASGRTGKECINYLIQKGRKCIATTRTGNFNFPSSDLLSVLPADVTNPASLQTALRKPAQGLGGVIYAASASKVGGTAVAVDRDGVIETAKACIALNIPRLVVISSGAVSKPNSIVYKFLNLEGGIMEAKIQGEDEVRSLYSNPEVIKKKLGYTVIRPGGLLLDAPVGASNLELNQGDTVVGRLPRADVAALSVESIFSPNAFDATFECYEALSANSLEGVFLSNFCK